MATAINVDRKSVLYMYVGGGAVDNEQSFLLGRLVVVCKNWKWAAMMYAAARIAGLACTNYFGNVAQELVVSADDDGTDTIATELLPTCAFPKLCEDVWKQLCSSSEFLVSIIVENTFVTSDERSMQPQAIGRQLEQWKKSYAAEVNEFIAAM